MNRLLDAIALYGDPQNVILVGMMAGIKGKSSMLDVLVPRQIYDVTSLGTRAGEVVPEPKAGTVDPTLHHSLSVLDFTATEASGIEITPHKYTATVSGKYDDLEPEMARRALGVDWENIVGLEMEGSALVEKQGTQSQDRRAIRYLMIKGVADYAGERPSGLEVRRLRAIPSLTPFLNNPDPTNNRAFKAAMQKEATIRSFMVAMVLLRSLS